VNRVVVDVLKQAEDLLPLALQVGLVQLPVPGIQFDLEDLLLLLRQVLAATLLLGPPHDQAA